MDIKTAQERRSKLERDISQSITELVRDFNEDTGIGIKDISLSTSEVTAMGDRIKSYLYEVEINLDI